MITKSLSAAHDNSAGSGTMNTMKAIRLHRRRGPEALGYEDAPIPALQPGDALVRVHAAGISPAEFTWHIWETPDGRSRLPLMPSHVIGTDSARNVVGDDGGMSGARHG
jgi:NADPH:quinone reductase-like Zn-dependent oxidoreductase